MSERQRRFDRARLRRKRRRALVRQWETWAIAAVAVLAVALIAVAMQHGRSSTDTAAAGDVPTVTASPTVTVPQVRTIGFGDSLTQSGSPDGKTPGTGWFGQLVGTDRHLRFAYNAGRFGNTTGAMLARLQTDVLARQPQFVTVMGGTNDVAQHVPTATTVGNLRAIVERLQAVGVKVALATIPPPGDPARAPATDALNAQIRALAAQRQVILLDLHDVLARGSVYRPGMSDDGVHPTLEGHRLLAKAAAEQLAKAGL